MVVEKKAFMKDLLRSIYKSKTRFLSILIIIAIGVGFYAGINATEPDMILSADKYYKDRNLSDFRIIAPLGFKEKDIEDIEKIEGVERIQRGYSKDLFLTSYQGNTSTIKLFSYDEKASKDNQGMNKPVIIKGRMPQKTGEIVLEHGSNVPEEIAIGSTITLTVPKGEEIGDFLKTNTYTVVGTVQSPLYINFERGQTNIGDGSIGFFAYINDADFVMEYSTDLFVVTKESKNLTAYTPEYKDHLVPIENDIKALGIQAMDRETQELKNELNEGKKELEENKQKAIQELNNAEIELLEAQKQIQEGEEELQEKEQQYKEELKRQNLILEEGQKKIEEAKKIYEKNHQKWQGGQREYTQGIEELITGKEQLDKVQGQIHVGETQLTQSKTQLEEAQKPLKELEERLVALRSIRGEIQSNTPISPKEWERVEIRIQQLLPQEELLQGEVGLKDIPQLIEILDDRIAELEIQYNLGQEAYKKRLKDYQQGLQELEQIKTIYQEQEAVYQEGVAELEKAKATLDEGKVQLDAAWGEILQNEEKIQEGMVALGNGERELEHSLEEGHLELEHGKKELEEGWKTFEEEKKDVLRQIQEAEEEIQESQRQILEIPSEWFVHNRDGNPGYSGYGDNAQRIGAVAKVFPLFFFLVAALVCLTTMTRMIEEERVQIGTLKALGYDTLTISSKYLIYGFLSSLVGTLIGLGVGFRLFPIAIMNAYGYMYNIPERITPYHIDYGIISVVLALTTTMGTVLFATLQELKATPANLMQPKAPKPGKRILLERITPLWKKFSFTQKVTARNIFRYKKRFLMTVLGISGCTALLLTGFGLRDSINGVMDKQFDEIFLYDAMVILDRDKDEEQRNLEEILGEREEIESYMYALSENINGIKIDSNSSYEANMIVPENEKLFENYFDLHERESQEDIKLTSNGVIITEKLSNLLGVKLGDTMIFRDGDNITYEVQVAGISEHYLGHYIYVSPQYYETIAAQKPQYNAGLFNIESIQGIDKQKLKEELIQHEGVLGIGFTEEIAEEFSGSIESLDSVMWILITSAGILAFVVLYNLTNINITERIREIATIKVLGFRDKEVSAYVYRENIILTIVGSLMGLGLGVLLHRYVIHTMELDAMMFGRSIHVISYLYSMILTMLFSILVNIFMFYKLKNVNMVESLKSIE